MLNDYQIISPRNRQSVAMITLVAEIAKQANRIHKGFYLSSESQVLSAIPHIRIL